MDVGPYQIQIFVSLTLVLGASLVALICDYLKGHNEQLRELTLELKVRREEEHKLIAVLTAQNANLGRVQASVAALAGKAADKQPAVPIEIHHEAVLSPETANRPPERERSLSHVASPAARSGSSAGRVAAIRAELKRTASAEAKAAMQRGVQRARGETPTPAPTVAPRPSVILEEVVAAAAPHVSATAQPRKDWNALLAHRSHPASATEPAASRTSSADSSPLLDAVMAATSTAHTHPPANPSQSLDPGDNGAWALGKLIQGHRIVKGAVIVIGVDGGTDESSPPVRTALESLLKEGELVGSKGEDEFVMLLPGARGPFAQRRMNRIAEQLWSLQLGPLGHQGIQFSWGGVEAEGEPLDDVIAAATSRMQETRHRRKSSANGHLSTVPAI